MTEAISAADASPSPFTDHAWFDPLEEAVRLQVRGLIEELLEEELEAALGRGRYERDGAGKGHRHGRRTRRLVTTFGPLELAVPRGRLRDATGEREWKSTLLPAYIHHQVWLVQTATHGAIRYPTHRQARAGRGPPPN
jgi:Transposase, Mutator family